jgi:hypothetical protein
MSVFHQGDLQLSMPGSEVARLKHELSEVAEQVCLSASLVDQGVLLTDVGLQQKNCFRRLIQLERRIDATETPPSNPLSPARVQITPARAQISQSADNNPSDGEATALRKIRSHLLRRLSALPMNDERALALVRDIRKYGLFSHSFYCLHHSVCSVVLTKLSAMHQPPRLVLRCPTTARTGSKLLLTLPSHQPIHHVGEAQKSPHRSSRS